MDENQAPPLPAGDYAIVELLGHRTLIGRVTEVEQFGSKMLGIEPIYQGRLLAQVLHGGGSIYSFVRCTAEVAVSRSPKYLYQLPAAVVATMPPELLEARAEDTAE